MVPWSGHEEVYPMTLVAGDPFGEKLSCLAHVGSPGQVGQDDVLVLETGQQFDEVVEVDVLSELGSVLMPVLKKSAFDDQDLGLSHHIGPFEGLDGHVAKVAEQRDFGGAGDFLALILELDDLRAA